MSNSIPSQGALRRSSPLTGLIAGRAGLTLLELVVVLTILAALAGILVPMLPNMLRRAHKSTDCTQSSELAKAVQTYQAMYLSYPDNFDLLTDGTAFPAYLPGGSSTPFGSFVTAGTLTGAELAALQRAGVRYLQPLAADTTPTGFHCTRYPYSGTVDANRYDLSTDTGTASSKQFAILSASAIDAATGSHLLETDRAADPTSRYVVFGVGARCSLVGQGIQEAPISAPQNKDFTPDTMYSRFGLIFKVSGTEVTRTERARLVAAVALEDDELEGTEKDLVGYYEVARDPRQ